MTYPLIDITRPVRLTEFGKENLPNIIIGYGKCEIGVRLHYPLTLYYHSFTLDGRFQMIDQYPSIENIPEETKMPNLIDPARPVKYRFIDNGSKFEFLMTIKNEYYPHVFKSTNGNGYENVAQYSECGECVIKNMHDQLDIENIPQDTEPPEEIFKIWLNGLLLAPRNRVTAIAEIKEIFEESQTYQDWKNKKITVEDVK